MIKYPGHYPVPGFREKDSAAVLVIIHYNKDLPYIILTKRSSSVKSHASQISFPGGKYSKDEDNSLLDTALRETKEEIGITFTHEDILGRLSPVKTLTSNFVIVPFVTLIDNLPMPKIMTEEVEGIIDVPLFGILANLEADIEHYDHASHNNVYKFIFQENAVWGATARILKQLHDLLL